MVQILINQAGPLPIQYTFYNEDDAEVMLQVSGSVWNATGNYMIGIQVTVNGNPVGNSVIYSNAPETHRATVPLFVPVTVPIGDVTIQLDAMPGTTSDENDWYSAVIHYFG